MPDHPPRLCEIQNNLTPLEAPDRWEDVVLISVFQAAEKRCPQFLMCCTNGY
jgi:hypothetical protein